MAQLNQVLLRGNLTRDPEKREISPGTSVVKFGLAVNRRYRSGSENEWKEDTCFVDIAVFGRQGDWTMENCSKGSPVLIDGRLSFNSWEAQDGSRRSKHEVVAFNVHFIARREEGGQGVASRSAEDQSSGGGWSGGGEPGGSAPPMTDDDIPF